MAATSGSNETFCTDTISNTRIMTNINDKHANSQTKPEKIPGDFVNFQ